MPQLPTSTPAEEYGAEDEVKQYTQEEDDCSDTSTVDVVNDIKGDLLCEDSPDSKTNDENLYRNPRYEKSESGGLYGSPAAVIVGPHNRYYDQNYRFNGGSQTYNNTYPTTRPSYTREGRPYYDHASWPQPPTGPQYPVYGGPQQKYYRYGGAIPGHGVPYYAAYPSMVGRPQKEIKRPHVKKPLNAFMLYMKEQRPKIAAEFTLKESAAINQILGKRWHALEKSEQAKYYEMARKERAIHMQLYPGWSARDNYAQIGRKKKRPRDKNEEMNPKKCRARYGLDRQEQWCKPCRRKKKCIRFIVGADGETTEVSEKQNETSDSDEDLSKDSKQNLHSLVSMAHSNNNNATNSSVHNNNAAVSQSAHNTAVSTIHTNNNNSSNNHNDESNKFESTHSTDNNNDVSITSSSLKSSQIYTERTITTLQTVTSSNNVISCS